MLSGSTPRRAFSSSRTFILASLVPYRVRHLSIDGAANQLVVAGTSGATRRNVGGLRRFQHRPRPSTLDATPEPNGETSKVTFTFEIARVDKLASAGVATLQGNLLAGRMSSRSKAELVHGGDRLPLRVKGGVLGTAPSSDDEILSLSVDLRQERMSVVQKGDLLVSA